MRSPPCPPQGNKSPEPPPSGEDAPHKNHGSCPVRSFSHPRSLPPPPMGANPRLPRSQQRRRQRRGHHRSTKSTFQNIFLFLFWKRRDLPPPWKFASVVGWPPLIWPPLHSPSWVAHGGGGRGEGSHDSGVADRGYRHAGGDPAGFMGALNLLPCGGGWDRRPDRTGAMILVWRILAARWGAPRIFSPVGEGGGTDGEPPQIKCPPKIIDGWGGGRGVAACPRCGAVHACVPPGRGFPSGPRRFSTSATPLLGDGLPGILPDWTVHPSPFSPPHWLLPQPASHSICHMESYGICHMELDEPPQ